MKRMFVVLLACVFVTLPLMACAATPELANLGD